MNDIPPGRCGDPAPGHMRPYSCELLAGHAGMHQANDWSANTETHIGPPAIVTWTDSKGEEHEASTGGVWVTYYWDQTLVIDKVWADEISALRASNGSGLYKAGFLPYGAEAREALA